MHKYNLKNGGKRNNKSYPSMAGARAMIYCNKLMEVFGNQSSSGQLLNVTHPNIGSADYKAFHLPVVIII